MFQEPPQFIFNPNNKQLIIDWHDDWLNIDEISVWLLDPLEKKSSIRFSSKVTATAFNSKGDIFAIANVEGKIILYETGKWEQILEMNADAPINYIALRLSLPSFLIWGDTNGKVIFWDLLSGKIATEQILDGSVNLIAFDKTEKYVAAFTDSQMLFWDGIIPLNQVSL